MRKLIPALLATSLLSLSATAGAATIEMKVDGLVCAFCAQGLEKSFRKNPAVADMTVIFEQQLVAIATKDGQDISDADLRKTVEDSGYEVRSIQRTGRTLEDIRKAQKAAHAKQK